MLLAVALGCFAGCGPPRVTSGGNTLIGAKWEIPVYPSARLVSSGSPTTFHRGDPAAPTAYDGVVWKLAYNEPAERVVTFYEDQLRESRRIFTSPSTDPPADDIDTDANSENATIAVFRYKPEVAVDDEEVTIEIYDRRIEIAQVARVE